MPKIISANLNGIRSAAKKGFFEWMAKQNADFVCVQELKAQAPDMTPEFLTPE
ncbi:MAG: exodeoxyribonuclease III, partial [Burkholderiaceae bacterium]